MNSNFWLNVILIFTLTNQNLILCMQYHSFTRIWVRIVFLFHPFKEFFSLSKDNGLFSPLQPSTIVFYIKLIDLLITHECDHSFGSFLPSEIKSQAFVFSPFGGWQGGIGPRGGLTPTVRDRKSVGVRN